MHNRRLTQAITVCLFAVVCAFAQQSKGTPAVQKKAPGTVRQTKSKTSLTPANLAKRLADAVRQGDLAAVKVLLAKGADVNSRDAGGNTPLMLAALGNHAEIVALLLDQGADPNAKSNEGRTPLMFAAGQQRSQIIQLLRRAGAIGYAQSAEATTVDRIKSTITASLDPNVGLGFLMGRRWVWCKLMPWFDFKAMKAVGNAYEFEEAASLFPNARYESEYAGYMFEFGERWGGREGASVMFRTGKVGSCKAIPVFVAEGTEALVGEKVFVYSSGNWWLKE